MNKEHPEPSTANKTAAAAPGQPSAARVPKGICPQPADSEAPGSPWALSRRMIKMGLSPANPSMCAGAVSLFSLVPWWRMWPRKVKHNTLEGLGAAVLPAVASGALNVQPAAPIGQAVFAAMLPLFDPVRAVEQCVKWVVTSVLEKPGPGPAPLMVVLEHLLKDRPEAEQARTWSMVMECVFDKEGAIRNGSTDQACALLETVGRSGIRALARWVLPALRHNDLEVVLSALACLTRLGVPDRELPAEMLLNQMRPELVGHARWALGFLEGGDLDLLTALLRHQGWGERVQALRLTEALLVGDKTKSPASPACVAGLADLLLTHLQQEHDPDVVRCLAVALGLALRLSGEAQITKALDVVAGLTEQGRLESLLNALLIAELPACYACRIEGFRKQAVESGHDAVRALNRVLMSLGNPSGSVRDWLEAPVVALLQIGAIRLPEPVRVWFDSPGDCPQEAVSAWLLERPAAGLTVTFAAAYLGAHPEFVHVLERVWIDAADNRKAAVLRTVGALLAGAAEDCAITPAELRCCLGHELGGALEESPEAVGQLLGLLMTQEEEVRESAMALLLLSSESSRALASSCMRALKRKQPLFGEDRIPLGRFGRPPVASSYPVTLPDILQPLFAEDSPTSFDPTRLLASISMPDEKSKLWVRRCVDWDKPEAVQAAFEQADTSLLASSFLQATSSPDPVSRELAGLLAAGIGQRLLETPLRGQVVQRVIWLAAHDPHDRARLAGRKAAESLGIASQVPATPAPPAPAPANGSGQQSPDEDDIDDLLRELMNDSNTDF